MPSPFVVHQLSCVECGTVVAVAEGRILLGVETMFRTAHAGHTITETGGER